MKMKHNTESFANINSLKKMFSKIKIEKKITQLRLSIIMNILQYENSNGRFEIGFPKKIYWPHFEKSRIFKNNDGTIISIVPQKYQSFKYFNSLQEQNKFFRRNNKKLKKYGIECCYVI